MRTFVTDGQTDIIIIIIIIACSPIKIEKKHINHTDMHLLKFLHLRGIGRIVDHLHPLPP